MLQEVLKIINVLIGVKDSHCQIACPPKEDYTDFWQYN